MACAFEVHRAALSTGVELAFHHEGRGGYPLLLLHGWPETKAIWERNVAPLAAAGFEVIAPDLRGFGDSSLAPDGHYHVVAHARDMHALVHGVLGHGRCAVVAGDLGAAVLVDLALRYAPFVERACVFNGVLPILPEAYAAAGLSSSLPASVRMAADYFRRHAKEADALAAELDTPGKRVRYVKEFYGHRFWAAPGAFSDEDATRMASPFADAARFRAGIANYEYVGGARKSPEMPRFFEPVPVPALLLYGAADHVVSADFPRRAAVAWPEHAGPFHLPDAGHFVQWEAADVLNGALRWFLADLRR